MSSTAAILVALHRRSANSSANSANYADESAENAPSATELIAAAQRLCPASRNTARQPAGRGGRGGRGGGRGGGGRGSSGFDRAASSSLKTLLKNGLVTMSKVPNLQFYF